MSNYCKKIGANKIANRVRYENSTNLPFLFTIQEKNEKQNKTEYVRVELLWNLFVYTSGCRFAINQIGRHGSNIAIAVVETKMAPAIWTIIVSDNKDE